MARNQLDNAQLEAYRDIADDVEESDFVPYACLFDEHSILTKNGELLQVIKITGFTFESVDHSQADLRSVIRRAIAESIQSNHYAVWLSTIRRKQKLSPDGQYPDEFSHHVHEAWKERNQWDRKFINELYVTIVREGESADITSVKGFFNGLWPARDRKVRNQYLDGIAIELNKTVDHALNILQPFGAQRLGVVKREDGIYYGEHLEFLEKLINLQDRPMPVNEMDLSQYLTSGEITFAYNAMEVRSEDDERRFGSVLTIKEYKEAALPRIDQFLQIPCEFIMTQCMDFVNAKRAMKEYEDQRYFLRVSGDSELAEKSELNLILNNNRNRPTDYGEQQTTMFILASSVVELENNIKRARATLNELGMVTVREDLKFEECYWAQLPANFEFLCRLNYVNAGHIGGFVNIQNFPAGNVRGCPWGPPVSLFYTAAGTPYFFNFHLADNGHTTVIGPKGSGKSVLMNFLLCEARKYQNRLFYLDARGHAQRFVRAIGGNYYPVSHAQSGAQLSPLSLPDNDRNREFLAMWLAVLMDAQGGYVNEASLAVLRGVVAQIYAQPADMRTLENVAAALMAQEPAMAQALAPWYGAGEHASYFDHISESVQPQQGIIGFDLSAAMHNPALLVPMASYLIHRISMTFDGTPAILVLDEAWRLLNNPIFAPHVVDWLAMIRQKNGLVIMASEEIDEVASYPFSAPIFAACDTQLYMPNQQPAAAYQSVFGLTEEEFNYIDAMSVAYRHFLLKRGREAIIAELNLGGMDSILAVLSGIEKDRDALPAAAQAVGA